MFQKNIANTVKIIITGEIFNKEIFTTEFTEIDISFDSLEFDSSSLNLASWYSIKWVPQFERIASEDSPFEENLLLDYANQIHAQNKKLRIFNAPDNQESWKVMKEAGVDLSSTDRLTEFLEFSIHQ